jgi:hypothetical protein
MYYDEESGATQLRGRRAPGRSDRCEPGAAVAPQSGRKTRKRLIRAVSTAREGAVDRWDDLTDEVQDAVKAGRKRIRL